MVLSILIIHNKYLEIIEEKLQRYADSIKDWSRPNKIHINYDKKQLYGFRHYHKLNNSDQFDLRTDIKQIKNTHNQKLRGIYIDDILSVFCSVIGIILEAVIQVCVSVDT